MSAHDVGEKLEEKSLQLLLSEHQKCQRCRKTISFFYFIFGTRRLRHNEIKVRNFECFNVQFYSIYENYEIHEIYEVSKIYETYEIYEVCEFYEIYEIHEVCEIYETYDVYEICEIIDGCEIHETYEI